ncbi:MAG: site-specific DNA-methyltransferase [Alphaproteobacteria bacterium]
MTPSPLTPSRYRDSNGFGRNFQPAQANGAIWLPQTTSAAASDDPENRGIVQRRCLAGNATFPSAHFRVIVTSPPYNLRNSSGHGLRDGRGGKWHNAALLQGYDQYDDCMSNDDYVAWQRLCLGEMMRLLRQDGAIFYNHKWRVQNGLLQDWHDIVSPFPVRQIIIWNRSGGINFNSGYFLPNYEVIYLITKPKFRLAPKANAQGCVWRINQEVDNSHPAPFPVALAERFISAVAKGLVLDPFIGSGSTAIAAEKLKRPWVGIEQSANYVSMAARRIGKMHDIIDDPQTPPA